MIIAYSFGYHVPELGGGIFGCAEIFTCKTFRQFADELRDPVALKGIFKFSREQYVPPSSMCVVINIDNNHRYTIRMKHVREYKKLVDDFIKSKEL